MRSKGAVLTWGMGVWARRFASPWLAGAPEQRELEGFRVGAGVPVRERCSEVTWQVPRFRSCEGSWYGERGGG